MVKLLGGVVLVLGQNLRNLMRGPVLVRIGALPQRFDLLELLPAKLIDIFVERHGGMRSSQETEDYSSEVATGSHETRGQFRILR